MVFGGLVQIMAVAPDCCKIQWIRSLSWSLVALFRSRPWPAMAKYLTQVVIMQTLWPCPKIFQSYIRGFNFVPRVVARGTLGQKQGHGLPCPFCALRPGGYHVGSAGTGSWPVIVKYYGFVALLGTRWPCSDSGRGARLL